MLYNVHDRHVGDRLEVMGEVDQSEYNTTDNRRTWSIKMIGDCELADVDGVRVGRDNNDPTEENFIYNIRRKDILAMYKLQS
jgi:hypothetical protein